MPNKRAEFISAVIPAYNESGRILPTLRRVNEYLAGRFTDFEIIVVNDGSTDGMEEMLLGAGEKMPSINYIGYKENRGKGYAIRKGVLASRGELIIVTDADLSTPIEDLEKLLIYYDNGYDLIIGSRALRGSDIAVRQPWWRQFMGKIFNKMVRLFVLEGFMDTQCGFKLFGGTPARDIFSHASIDRFAYDVEALYIAKKAGYKIKEAPVRWLNSPESKVSPIKDSLRMALDLLKIRFRVP